MKFIQVTTQWEGVGYSTSYDADCLDKVLEDIKNTIQNDKGNLLWIRIEPDHPANTGEDK